MGEPRFDAEAPLGACTSHLRKRLTPCQTGFFALNYTKSLPERPESFMQILRATADELRLWRTNDEDVRQKLKDAWLERTGGLPFRLMSSNGRFMGTVRAENSQAEPQFSGVSPEACACKDLTGTPDGMHHPICKNRELWEAYRGGALPVPGMQAGLGVQLMKIAKPTPQTSGVVHHQIAKKIDIHTPPISTAHEGKARAPAVMQPMKQRVLPALPVVPVLPPPETCKCTQFTKGLNHDQKQHHPICEFFEKWKAAHPTPIVPTTPLGQTDVGNLDIKTTSPTVNSMTAATPAGSVQVVKTETQAVTEQILKENAERDGSAGLQEAADHHRSVDEQVGSDCVLVDLNTRQVMREATLEEITEAALEEEKSGAPTVVVDETMYAVLKRSEVESALPSRS